MKKLLAFTVMCFAVLSGMAQNEKTVLFFSLFKNSTSKSDVIAKNLRNEIMAGIMAKNRVTVVDATTLEGLPTAKNELLKALNGKGIHYLLEGTVNTIDQKTDKDSKGNTQYVAEINYTLTLTDTETGATKSTDTYKDSWHVGDTSDEAILKAIEKAKNRMAKFVDDKFKLEATIKALDQIDEKKGAVKTCYITIGSEAGIAKGQIFEVFANVEVAGEQVQKKIAEVRAKEVMSPTLTLCDVKSGGAEIKKNFDKQITLTVISRATKDPFGVNGILK